MPSTPHTTAQKTAAQTQYTALATAITAMNTAHVTSAAAAHAADRQELQLVITREGGTALS